MAGRFRLTLCLAALAACSGEPEMHVFGGDTMGSTFEVKFVGDAMPARVREVVEAKLAEFDAAFSKWRDDSEIARCNRTATTAPFAATPLFLRVVALALELAAATEGAFDPTVEPLSRLFRAAKAAGQDLDQAELAAAGARVGWRHVSVEDGAVHRAKPGVELDLDGIVAGACIDAIAAALDGMDLSGYYLEVTGEVFCRGEKAPGVPWRIGVVDPRADLTGGEAAFTVLPLRDRALCTSGDYRNAFVSAGEVVHHVFDPRTGRAAASRVVSASVLAASAAVADAVSTAMLVLGEDRVQPVVERLADRGEIAVLLLIAGENGPRKVEFGWPEEEEE